MTFEIRALEPGDWMAWRAIRLGALADSPESFESTHEDESLRPDEWWIDIIEGCIAHDRCRLWFAEDDGEPVGMTFATVDTSFNSFSIGAMWVAPEARGRGIGRALLDTAITWGLDEGANRADLWVTVGNSAAEHLYETAGFTTEMDRKPLRPGTDAEVRRLVRTFNAPGDAAP